MRCHNVLNDTKRGQDGRVGEGRGLGASGTGVEGGTLLSEVVEVFELELEFEFEGFLPSFGVDE